MTPSPWSTARTLGALAAANRAWLCGDLTQHPLTAEPPDPDPRMLSVLDRLNGAGLVTVGHQPGAVAPPAHAQRAYLGALCTASTLQRLVTEIGATELVLIMYAPRDEGAGDICVTVLEHTPAKFVGSWPAAGLDPLRNGTELDAQLDEAWRVQIFDPVWGREDRLWWALMQAMRV